METYMKVKDLNLEGTLIDNGWIENLKYDSGKPNMNAILILSEIVYWYKPTQVRDEKSGVVLGYKKKFKADKLQKSYDDLAARFGLTKRQAKAAVKFLVEKEIISIEFRTVQNKIIMNNVMFVDLLFDNLKLITGINRVIDEPKDIQPVIFEAQRVLHSDVRGCDVQTSEGVTFERQTNTETTTEITAKITTGDYNNNNRGQKDKYEKDNENSIEEDENQVENENNYSPEDITTIKDKADVKLGTKTNKNTILNLVKEYGYDKVNYYLSNWERFGTVSKHNTVGFFINAVRGGWDFPKNSIGRPAQASNYEQREYDDDHYESFYDNFNS